MAEISKDRLERINILLKEYDTLRAEILQRTNAGFALVGVEVAAFTWLLTQCLTRGLRWWQWLILFLLALVFGCAAWKGQQFINVQIRRCAVRIWRIERWINYLAGDHLLEWETRWGMGATGHHLRDEFPLEVTPPPRIPAETNTYEEKRPEGGPQADH